MLSHKCVGPGLLASCCQKNGIQLVTFSSDLVFDGLKAAPYTEEDFVSPLNVYGRSKADGERMVLDKFKSALIIRTSAFFGPWDSYNFAYYVLDCLENNKQLNVVDDIFISPTYVPDLVQATLDLLIDEESGIWHLANNGIVSWAEFAKTIANIAGIVTNKIEAKTSRDMNWIAPRPLYSALDSKKGDLMPCLDNALERFFCEKNFK